MKTIIAGGRDFTDFDILWMILCAISDPPTEIVSGGARGADKLGEKAATDVGIPLKVFRANWDLYGKSAGYKRNVDMAIYADALIAFWDGKSRGTKHMIDIAIKNNLIVRVYDYRGHKIDV